MSRLLEEKPIYRGRLAPSPTGYLHLGHARTFWIAQERARIAQGQLILRNDDLDRSRVRPEFVEGFIEDLKWFELHWDEGPDIGGPFAPYNQSERIDLYRTAFEKLREAGLVYPCSCSRQDVLRALEAPHQGEEEPIYPGTCRDKQIRESIRSSWRFRIENKHIMFNYSAFGPQQFCAGADFGDFVVWRHDGLPAYQLACVVDDHFMEVTEVVRGADLILSTARQLLLYQALAWDPPAFYHCPLMTDEKGVRLAKRHDALSLRELRRRGATPKQLQREWIEGDFTLRVAGKSL